MLRYCRLYKRPCFHALSSVPFSFGVLIWPRRLSAAAGIYAGTHLYITLLPQGLFIPCFLWFPIPQGRRTLPAKQKSALAQHSSFYIWLSDTLGGIITLLSLIPYALRWRVMFPLTSELAMIKQFIYPSKPISVISRKNSLWIKFKYLAPFCKGFCCIPNLDVDICASIIALFFVGRPSAIVRWIAFIIIYSVNG